MNIILSPRTQNVLELARQKLSKIKRFLKNTYVFSEWKDTSIFVGLFGAFWCW